MFNNKFLFVLLFVSGVLLFPNSLFAISADESLNDEDVKIIALGRSFYFSSDIVAVKNSGYAWIYFGRDSDELEDMFPNNNFTDMSLSLLINIAGVSDLNIDKESTFDKKNMEYFIEEALSKERGKNMYFRCFLINDDAPSCMIYRSDDMKQSLNKEIILDGLSRLNEDTIPDDEVKVFREYERAAKSTGSGVWASFYGFGR